MVTLQSLKNTEQIKDSRRFSESWSPDV